VLRSFALIVCIACCCTGAPAQSIPPASLPEVSVIATTPLPGIRVDADKVPGNVQSLLAGDLKEEGAADLRGALDAHLGSVSLGDTLADPFQPDIVYRGFEASPVLGAPEGLAIYQNAVRINEAFGDTVNWDLIPDVAIRRVDLLSSNPLYGLNALGGAMAITMKNGFTFQGTEGVLSGGSFGRRSGTLEAGFNEGALGLYGAAQVLDQNGWRQFAHDSLRRYYIDVALHEGSGTMDLSYSRAQNQLFGPGAAPVQSLALDPEAVFTGPQNNVNNLDFVTLNASLDLGRGLSLQSVGYFRNFRQSVANGNGTNYTACTSAADAGSLCQPDGLTPLISSAGAALPDISEGGRHYIGEIDAESINSQSVGGSLQLTGAGSLFDRGNQFALGASADTAHIDFTSTEEIGLIDSSLMVVPSGLFVDTPENTGFAATPVDLRATNRYYGLYATDTLDASSRLAVTASGRYNIAEIDLSDQLGSNLSGNNRFTHFNPALGATYKLASNLTAFAGYSVNNRAPNASEIECSSPLTPCLLPSSLAGDPPTLKQVVAHSVEFGLRGRMGLAGSGRIEWNTSVFRTDLDDDIYGIATSVSSGYFQNIGSTRREGLETGVTYQDEHWSAHAQYSFIEATFCSALTLSSPFNPFRNADGDIQVVPGDRLPGIPQHRLKADADYTIVHGWTIGGSLILVSSQYYHGDESNQNPPLPGYHIVNLRSSYRIGERVEFFANVHNVFDERYAGYGLYSDPTGVGAPGIPPDARTNDPRVDNRFENPGEPRAVFAGIRLSF